MEIIECLTTHAIHCMVGFFSVFVSFDSNELSTILTYIGEVNETSNLIGLSDFIFNINQSV